MAVEPDGDAWVVFMRDVSAALFPDDLVLSRAQSHRILQAAGALYEEFWGEYVDGLCTVTDLYAMLSPKTAERERDGQHPIPKMIGRGWELFGEVVEPDVAEAVYAILQDPGLLAEQLEVSETTLIHGDRPFRSRLQ